MIRRFLIPGLICVFTGCSLTAPRDVGNANRVLLEAVTESASCHKKMGSMVIAYPDMPDMLDTSRIALIDQNGHWDYFVGMRWADFLGENIQSALVGSFSASGNFSFVVSDDTIAHDRLRLSSEVHKFTAVYHADVVTPDVEIEIIFALHDDNNQKVNRQFTATSTVKAEANTIVAISQAFEKAFVDIQRDAVENISHCKS